MCDGVVRTVPRAPFANHVQHIIQRSKLKPREGIGAVSGAPVQVSESLRSSNQAQIAECDLFDAWSQPVSRDASCWHTLHATMRLRIGVSGQKMTPLKTFALYAGVPLARLSARVPAAASCRDPRQAHP